MTRFLRDTAVDEIRPGLYSALIDPGWWIIAGPNGGYVAAIAARGIIAAVGNPERRLRTLALHYLRPPVAGPLTIEIEIERAGRRVTVLSFRLVQDGRAVVIGTATAAESAVAPAFDDVAPPSVPTPEDVPLLDTSGTPIPMHGRYDLRPCLGPTPWDPPSDAGEARAAVTGGWIRLNEATPTDETVLAALSDAWWPPVFSRFPGEPLAVPTVDLTIRIVALPADPFDWVLGHYVNPVAADGYLIEDASLFSRDGQLLATSRQLAVFS